MATSKPAKHRHGCGMGAGHLDHESAFHLILGLRALDEGQTGVGLIHWKRQPWRTFELVHTYPARPCAAARLAFLAYPLRFGVPRMWVLGGSISLSNSCVNIAAAKNATARNGSLPVFSTVLPQQVLAASSSNAVVLARACEQVMVHDEYSTVYRGDHIYAIVPSVVGAFSGLLGSGVFTGSLGTRDGGELGRGIAGFGIDSGISIG